MLYFVIDLETTGTYEHSEITEIAILNNQTMELVTWMVRIKHPERCDPGAMFITNKIPQELANRGRYIEEVLPEVEEFIKSISEDKDNLCGIGHNSQFDRRFLEKAWRQVFNKELPITYWLCTLSMSRKFVKSILHIDAKTSFKLCNMIKLAGIKEIDGMHNAGVDVKQTFLLYRYMISRGMSNTEFIKMNPSQLTGLNKTAAVAKEPKPKKSRVSSKKKALDANVGIEDLGNELGIALPPEEEENNEYVFNDGDACDGDIDADDYAAP